LPLKASLPFGYYLLYKFSFLKVLLLLTFPVAIIERSLPFGGLLFFIILFAGVVKKVMAYKRIWTQNYLNVLQNAELVMRKKMENVYQKKIAQIV
jgi:hypothetical protein